MQFCSLCQEVVLDDDELGECEGCKEYMCYSCLTEETEDGLLCENCTEDCIECGTPIISGHLRQSAHHTMCSSCEKHGCSMHRLPCGCMVCDDGVSDVDDDDMDSPEISQAENCLVAHYQHGTINLSCRCGRSCSKHTEISPVPCIKCNSITCQRHMPKCISEPTNHAVCMDCLGQDYEKCGECYEKCCSLCPEVVHGYRLCHPRKCNKGCSEERGMVPECQEERCEHCWKKTVDGETCSVCFKWIQLHLQRSIAVKSLDDLVLKYLGKEETVQAGARAKKRRRIFG
jgi:hypothetical protein